MHSGHFETNDDNDNKQADDNEEERTDHLREETHRGHDCKRENWKVCDVIRCDRPIWVSRSSGAPSPGSDVSCVRYTFVVVTTSTMLSIATRQVPVTLASRAALVRAYASSAREGSVAQSREFG